MSIQPAHQPGAALRFGAQMGGALLPQMVLRMLHCWMENRE
jgi:hypothetical protein